MVVLNAKARSCETLAVTIQGMTAIYGASLGPGNVTGNTPSGIPGEQLAGLVSASNAARAICQVSSAASDQTVRRTRSMFTKRSLNSLVLFDCQ